jgi:hypothetical protein
MHKPRLLFFSIAGFALTLQLAAQAPVQPDPAASNPGSEPKRLFGIIPNYRTIPSTAPYKPLTPGAKFKLATKDAFDPGTFLLAAFFAGEGQLTNASPSFGQGAKGYGHYFITSYADWAGADYMTGAVFPVLLHQDPRYFRKGVGSGFSRLTYAMSRIVWTRTDSGGTAFNFSELGGNATMVAISQSYYPDNRDAGDAASMFAIQVADDMASNILKEFYPDLMRKLRRKHGSNSTHH